MDTNIYLCPHCDFPTFFGISTRDNTPYQLPGSKPGESVANLPVDLNMLYEEARQCVASGCYTASVMISRKMLMNIAVAHGAKEGESFQKYVEYLESKGYVPPNGKQWVDHIRQRGNEANHEIALMSEADAMLLVTFVGFLLRFIYEFPGMVP